MIALFCPYINKKTKTIKKQINCKTDSNEFVQINFKM